MKFGTVLALVFVLSGAVLRPGQASPLADPWAKLDSSLVGEWKGIGTGAPGEGVGGTKTIHS